jgi:ribosomal protein S18 acetylase RimI-like enzyme
MSFRSPSDYNRGGDVRALEPYGTTYPSKKCSLMSASSKNIEIQLSSDISEISWIELARLYELAPLGKKRDPKKLETAFRNSQLRVFAFHDAKLIGAGRALSDSVWRAAIYDVAVLPEYQGKGIGSMITRHLIESANVDLVMLFAAPGKEDFYKKFGFSKMTTAMAIMPDEGDARKRGLIE